MVAKHVAVLMGGLSAEAEVSRVSAKGVVETLTRLGYRVTPLEADYSLAPRLLEIKPDVVYNCLHGTYGEDGCVQGLLEMMKLPYTHSGVLASAVAMDKQMTKDVLEHHGVLFPAGRVASR